MERARPQSFFNAMHGILIFCIGLLTLAAVLSLVPSGGAGGMRAEILDMLLR